jgi:hypothetical protein
MARGQESFTLSRFIEERFSVSSDPGSMCLDTLSVDGHTLPKTFNRVAIQRDAARRDLSFTIDAIKELETHVIGPNYLLSKAQQELGD